MLVPSGFGSSKVAQMETRAEKRVHSLMPATIDELKRNGLWDKVQLLMMPDAYSEGKLHTINQEGTSATDFIISRGSAKNTIDSEGYIRKVPANYPSINYSTGNPVVRTDTQAQNKFLYWRSFENNYWTKINCTIDTNNGNFYPSPFKDDNGNVVLQSRRIYDTADSSGAWHNLHNESLPLTAGNPVSITEIVKRGSLKAVSVEGYVNGDNKGFNITYNFDDDSIYSQLNLESYRITKLADGWVEISITTSTTSNATTAYAYLTLADDSGNTTYQGDGTGYIELAYSQFNEGNAAGIICPYNAFENHLVTRLADNISVTIPSGVVKITEIFSDDTENVITTIPSTYLLANDKEYSKIIME